MPLQIIQNIYPASGFYLTGHCYVRLMFVKYPFFIFCCGCCSVVVCLFVAAVVYYIIIIIIISNWYKLDCKVFAELCKFFPISNKLLIIIRMCMYMALF